MKAVPERTFPGFPPEALKFLRSLKRNNNREWFLKNKTRFEDSVRHPMEALVSALAPAFKRFAPGTVATPKASIYRIYRDTRFSHDKRPYKTHAAASFPCGDVGKHEGAGFYLHFSPEELLVGGGLYMPLPEDLAAVRSHIAANLRRFERILQEPGFRRLFGQLSGEQLTRVPRGFARDHPAAFYLRFKQFLAGRTLPAETVTRRTLFPMLVETFETMAPLVAFINEAILANRRLQKRRDALLQ